MSRQELREKIAALIEEHVIAVSMSDSWIEGEDEAADAILNLITTEGQAGDVGELRQNPEQMFKNFEDEGWNAKRERCEKAVMTAVTELMVGVMGGASKTVFEPEEGCPYRITIEYGEVQNGQFN